MNKINDVFKDLNEIASFEDFWKCEVKELNVVSAIETLIQTYILPDEVVNVLNGYVSAITEK